MDDRMDLWECRLEAAARYTPRKYYVTGDPCARTELERLECERKGDALVVWVWLPIAKFECKRRTRKNRANAS